MLTMRRCPHYLREDDRVTITARPYRDERDLGVRSAIYTYTKDV
jgi:hypothetical protein